MAIKERGIKVTDEREAVIVHYDIELDDAQLDPFQFRAYQRIARRCAGSANGKCTESLLAMATSCLMSRPTLVRALKVLIQRRMIARQSKIGLTSHYALLDKKNWLSFEKWQAKYPAPGKGENHVTRSTTDSPLVKERATPGKGEIQVPGKPQIHKEDNKENKKEDKKETGANAPPLSRPLPPIEDSEVTPFDKLKTLISEATGELPINGAALKLEQAAIRIRQNAGDSALDDLRAYIDEQGMRVIKLAFIAGDFCSWNAARRRARSVSQSAPQLTNCSRCAGKGFYGTPQGVKDCDCRPAQLTQ